MELRLKSDTDVERLRATLEKKRDDARRNAEAFRARMRELRDSEDDEEKRERFLESEAQWYRLAFDAELGIKSLREFEHFSFTEAFAFLRVLRRNWPKARLSGAELHDVSGWLDEGFCVTENARAGVLARFEQIRLAHWFGYLSRWRTRA